MRMLLHLLMKLFFRGMRENEREQRRANRRR
jgi:hypothetical protein